MDKIIEGVNEIKGGKMMGHKTLNIVCYADNAILMAKNENDLQWLLYRFQIIAEKLNMMTSAKKSDSMAISKEPICPM